MRVAVRTFAAYREAIGREQVEVEAPEPLTVGEVWTLLAERFPGLRRYAPPARFVVNDEFVSPDHRLRDADEVALIPPVSGGAVSGGAEGEPEAASPRITVRLTAEPIRPEALVAAVADPAAGAVVLFCGTVREGSRGRRIEHLEYEAYAALAEREMRRIAEEAAQRWPLCAVALVHRTGRLHVGEVSVGVAATSAHRAEAFAAARFLIDTLKQVVPIWKKEVWAGGGAWVGAAPAEVAAAAAPPRPAASSGQGRARDVTGDATGEG
jgi:molybdopterin synthase catalytic subunit